MENTEVNMYRNPAVYGNIQFRLWNMSKESYVGNATIRIDDLVAVSDAKGVVKNDSPFSQAEKRVQTEFYSSFGR